MYTPAHFKQEDWEKIQQFIKAHPFATLVSIDGKYPVATHIPVELERNFDGETVLWGHIARNNRQWKSFENHPDVLAIFQSHHSYISSSWYNKPEVPTWNYRAVHVYGTITELSEKALRASLRRQIDRYERESTCPVSMDTLPKSIVEPQLKGVFGFEISIEKVEAADKLSQNHSDRDQNNIIRKLFERGDPQSRGVAKAMEEEKKQ